MGISPPTLESPSPKAPDRLQRIKKQPKEPKPQAVKLATQLPGMRGKPDQGLAIIANAKVVAEPAPRVGIGEATGDKSTAGKEAGAPEPIRTEATTVATAIDAARASEDPDAMLTAIAEESAHLQTEVSLNSSLAPETQEKMQGLRDPEKVGPTQYGESLVNTNHAKATTVLEHEAAQVQAYTDLDQKIEAGLVDPSLIGAEICAKLGVKPDLENTPEGFDAISVTVNTEIQQFMEQGSINQQEMESITREVQELTRLYAQAYGTENVTSAYELIRDNARKLTYQAAVDKDVFSGSDHGTRHILDGNTRFAMQMVQSLRANGVNVSAKDELLIHQTMIDHDLGYSTGAAQAPRGFNASKDHPLFSAKFIEANKPYYVGKFGEDGYRAIQTSVLNHSYPKLEYQSDATDGVHEGVIRGITSTVDSLGVTVETKTPEFFWNKDAMRTLLKIRLAMETMGGKVPPELMGRYKEELQAIAGKEQNSDRSKGYGAAIDGFFNEVTADNTLGHFTGVVRSVSVEEVPGDTQTDITQEHTHDESSHGDEHSDMDHKKLRVVVQMTPTEVYALLGNMFGDKLANQSFKKAIQDLGLDSQVLEGYARTVRSLHSDAQKPPSSLDIVGKEARVSVENNFLEDLPSDQRQDVLNADKIQLISEVFQEVETVSIRTEINTLLDEVQAKGTEVIPEIGARFEQSMGNKNVTAGEIDQLRDLIINLSDQSLTGEKDNIGQNITVSQQAQKALKSFLTGQEKEFLGIV